MPTLAGLLDRGRWSDVTGGHDIGSGAVWPTFYTGTPPQDHGRYAEWLWQPGSMSVKRIDGDGLRPFWADMHAAGATIGVLDVPYAPIVGLDRGFEIQEWGAHDFVTGQMVVSPRSVTTTVGSLATHPYRPPMLISRDPAEREPLARLARESIEGIKLRTDLSLRLLEEYEPDLAIVVYPELHHAGHDLWHTIEPDHFLYETPRYATKDVRPSLVEIYQAADDALGRVVEAVSGDTSIVVFSLHGMRAGPGVLGFVSPLLHSRGFATASDLRAVSGKDKLRTALRSLKRSSPSWMRRLYKRSVPHSSRVRMARSTMVEPLAWSDTRAFPLPVEWHGYARVNLRGRESAGIVPPPSYEEVCRDVASLSSTLTTRDGRSMVKEVVMPGAGRDPSALPVPDVVIHWDPLAHLDGLEMSDPRLNAPKVGEGRTGEHETAAFCITTGPLAASTPAVIDAASFGPLFARALAL